MIKAQKRSKEMVKKSMLHQWFYEATRILFVRIENKNNDFIQQFVSSASPYSAILESITYTNNICCSVSVARYAGYVFTL